jgi:glycosyltransferase involved in cell wall biosynthesis
MAAGLPIASSSAGPMPEVLGNAGVYFDPSQSQDIARAMRELMNNVELRRRITIEAKELSRVYSWHRCAKDTFDFIAAVTTQRPYRGSQSCLKTTRY